ncbi:terminase large subunit [Brucella phage Iz]|nr:terminase large subunit [Brucella phage Iz]
MLFMPPGSAKSSYGSVVVPSWAMGQKPGFKVIGVSYGSDMAKKFGRRTRSIIKQSKYRALFSTSLSGDQAAADEWALDNGSEYMSGGILSGITGNRADCLVAGTMIETSEGPVAIENIEHCPASVKVLSFNHRLNMMEYQDIEAFSHRKGIGIYRVTTARGSVVEATGNHQFYTGRGYVKASSLAPGDSLLSQLRKGEGETSIRLPEMGGEVRKGSLLLPSLQPRARVVQGQEKVRRVREPDGKEDAQVLRHMPSSSKEVAPCDSSANLPRLPDLQQDFQSGLAWQEGGGLCRLLQPNMCGHRPFSAYEREGEPDVEGWSYASQATASFSPRVQGDEAADRREGWLHVRDMRGRQEATRSPHRQLADEQRVNEFGNPLSSLPQGGPQELAWEAERDHVISVERIGDEASVFDIQVSKNHNFFANGILVHNCVIIDDPIKGRQDADSEVIRQRTWDEYQESVLTRLKPGGSIIIIQTRWHEDDLSGRILPDNYAGESGMIMGKDGFEWEVICLAAECERADDPLGREIGQMLWEEWFDEKHWQVHRKNPRTWSALFQQRPAPDSGDYFKKEWIKLVSASQVPPLNTMSIYGASDYAVTNNGGDYTVHVVVGVDSEGRIWLLDIWRQQASSDRWVDSFCDLVRKWKPIGWAEETGQIKSGVGPFLVKRMIETGSYVAREQFPTRGGDKSVRAQSIRGRIALSGLYVRDDLPGLDALMSEMMSFPVGVHDDQVDALGLVGQLMDRMTPGKPQKKPERMDYSAVYASPLPGQRKRV